MADNKIRVLFRSYFGLPFRQASEEEKKSVVAAWKEMSTNWKTSGVKLVGSFSGLSNPGGFCHHVVYEVDDIDTMRRMNSDVLQGAVGKYSERYDFSVGTDMVEKMWKDL